MNRATYRPKQPTQSQKDAAMDFYKPDDLGDPAVSKFLQDAVNKPQPSGRFTPHSELGLSDAYEHAEVGSSMRGQLTERAKVRQFIGAGNATITVVSKATSKRFTFKFGRPKDWQGPTPQKPVAPIFASLLSGADNEGDYTYLGTIWPENNMFADGPLVYRHGTKSRVTFSAESVKALAWFIMKALAADDKFAQVEVWHEGRCGRCGRKLTVPSSIESGYGPECIGKLGA